MEITREFCPGSRYVYDFGLCSSKNGFAQLDTGDDAECYGNWANPEKRIIFSYVEGDCTMTECDTDAEFVAEIRRSQAWHKENTGKFAVDAGLRGAAADRWNALGLGDLLH